MPLVPRETHATEKGIEANRFLTLLEMNGLRLTEGQAALLDRYKDLLVKWNEKLNLVSRSTTAEEIQFTHFTHSLSPFFFLSLPGGLRLMDLGTGGGLPGIPLAVLRPDLHIVLVDSIAKKVKAVESMRDELGLSNVEVMNTRAEEISRKAVPPEPFDLVLARAVAPLSNLAQWSRTLVRQRNVKATWREARQTIEFTLPALMAWKGGDITDELAALKIKTGLEAKVFNLVFPGSEEVGLQGKKMVIVELRKGGGRT